MQRVQVVVIYFALLLGLVAGSPSAPAPTAPAPTAPAPIVRVTVQTRAPAASGDLRDPFAGPIRRVRLAAAAHGLQDPFDAAHLAARVRAPRARATTLQDPFAT